MINTLFFIIIFSLILFFCGIFSKERHLEAEMLSIDHTNIAKGIACIMIVIHHIAGIEGLNIFSPFGGIGVCIFLICSGYGLSISYKKYGLKNFVIKRFFRILIPFFVVNVITYMYIFFADKDYSVLTNTYIFWYVYYIMGTYIIFYVVYKFFYKYRIPLIIIAIAAYSELKGYPVTIQQIFSFSTGILIFEYSNKLIYIDNNKCKNFIGVSLIILSAVFLLLKNIFKIYDNNYLINTANCVMIMSGAVGIIFLSYFLLKCKYISMALKYIGKLSYEVYLVHLILIKLFKEISFTPIVSIYYILAFIIISKLIFEFSNYVSKAVFRLYNKFMTNN